MSAFRRRLMMMQDRPRKAVAVRTVDGEVIPVQTLYDYELAGQVQDELYEQDGKMWLRKNIAEFLVGEMGRIYKTMIFCDNIEEELYKYYLKPPENDYTYNGGWDSTNAFYHVIPESIKTCRQKWTYTNFKPGTFVGIRNYGTGIRAYIKDGCDVTIEEVYDLLTGSRVRVAPNIEEQIKTYEVEEVIYE